MTSCVKNFLGDSVMPRASGAGKASPAFRTSHAKGSALRAGCFSPSCTAACSHANMFLELMTTSSP